MKTIRFYVWMLLAALAGVAFTACEDDKPDPMFGYQSARMPVWGLQGLYWCKT